MNLMFKKQLPRRTFLRGMGTVVALPLLDAMVPALSALTATAGKPARIRNGTLLSMPRTITEKR